MKAFVKMIFRSYNAVYNYFILKFKKVEYGKNLKINGRIYINNNGSIVIGDDVTINSGQTYNPVGGSNVTKLIAQEGGRIEINNGCGISNSTLVSKKSIVLGDNCFVGGSVNILDTDFHSIYANNRINGDIMALSRDIIIEKNVFIGAHSIILKGCYIGAESVIGAGSVIAAKKLTKGSVVAGNPAQVLKHL